MNTSLPWPDGAEVLPIASLRPVLDRLASLVTTHDEDAETIPGLAVAEEDVTADPPPALEQLVDELGGIALRGVRVLDLLIEDRTDVGPYTLLGDARTYYPLYETPDAAVVLTLDELGAPGAVHGIGEDLSLQLAAPDLPTYLGLFADALEATLSALAERGPAEEDERKDRDEAAEQLMDAHLFAALLGMVEDVPAVDFAAAEGTDAADGAVALADLRGAALGTRVDPMDVDVPGDPLEMRLAWRERGLVIAVHGG